MKLKTLSIAAASVALTAAPIAAHAAASSDRVAAPVAETSELAGGIGPAFIIVALAAVGMGILLLTDDDDNEVPASA